MKHKVYIKINHRHLAEVLIARRIYDDAKQKETQVNKK